MNRYVTYKINEKKQMVHAYMNNVKIENIYIV